MISVVTSSKNVYNSSQHTIKGTAVADPFAAESIRQNPDLFIANVNSGHTLVLNKFNTFKDHVSVHCSVNFISKSI